MLSDIEISSQSQLIHIENVAASIGINKDGLTQYGDHMAKVKLSVLDNKETASIGKLIFVTAMTPTPYGERKTVTTVGLTQGLSRLGHQAVACIRQPSMGPVFGLKGGAAGGGYSQVLPMDKLNLHCTGDIHAITSAHNLAAAAIDARLYHEELLGYDEYEATAGEPALKIDKNNIVWKRAVDNNDRSLRMVTVGKNEADKTINGIERNDGFMITAASELMAIMTLSSDLLDMRSRIGKVILAYSIDGKPITAEDAGVAGAMTVIMKDVIEPTLMQTNENVPVFVHGEPFASIAHGNSSIVADEVALKHADFVVTEGGFGSDMGFEKALNIKVNVSKRYPDAAVIVATIKAIKSHSTTSTENLNIIDIEASQDFLSIKQGFKNLKWHIENVQKYNVPVVVAINRFEFDSESEIKLLGELIANEFSSTDVRVEVSEAYAYGGLGCIALAKAVIELCQKTWQVTRYNSSSSSFIQTLEDKIYLQAQLNYGSDVQVTFSSEAKDDLRKYNEQLLPDLPLCFAKSPNVIFEFDEYNMPIIKVQRVHLNQGAGFYYLECGSVMTMPGLGIMPAYRNIDINAQEFVIGLD